MEQFNNNIDIISTSTACSFNDNEEIKKILIKKNFNPNFFNQKNVSHEFLSDNFFANCDAQERYLNFKQACENPHSKIIWCNRGGYGSADILPFLYQMPKPKIDKILIGFSDVAVIANYVVQNWGWKVLCAPMLYQILKNKVSHLAQEKVFDLVSGKIDELNYDVKLLKGDMINLEAEIVGGCVSVLSSNYATKNQLEWHDKILFLEDEGEDGERLERYFTQIAFMINEGKSKPRAILLGNFLENNEFGSVNHQKITIAIKRFCEKIDNIPIWQEVSNSLGHSYNQQPLILGLKSQITSNQKLVQKINLNFFNKVVKN